MDNLAKKYTILGVAVDTLTRSEAIKKVKGYLVEQKGRLVCTPNPEMLVAATQNENFRKVLNSADLNIPDGIGLIKIANFFGGAFPERISGSDFILDICHEADDQGLSVYLLGGQAPDVALKASIKLKELIPGLRIAGAENGSTIQVFGNHYELSGGEIERINKSGASILFVAFNHVKQETWLADNMKRMPNVRLGMGVGGTFDFLAGYAIRAPLWMRNLGLEWLWRLIKEPKRWHRIWTAVIVFPYLVIRHGNGKIH